jgi:hypothetical protein
MSNLFLNSESLNNIDYQEFKNGIIELILIEKKAKHTFWKNSSIYNLSIITEELYAKLSSQEEQEIFRFIEQLKLCNNEINTEIEANEFCKSESNGFLGIDFSEIQINLNKQVKNQPDYNSWCYLYHPNPEDLLVKSENIPSVHLANHHGKKELAEFSKKLINCPYIKEIQSTDWGGKKFIRKINDDNSIEIVLPWTEREYALKVFTTGRNRDETELISKLINEKYNEK